ncbi:uncharacterized protein DSM5745_04045 [Aspergillus mulundensis]|uniref:DUF7730 domain-containing protein n=1 Tax=Aspergillus mulundensis TaxID=1810919 RepID=A0A3D8SBI1_9EURO|nr:hypothetical protein DSM5745_04045 [Aspergillus mulundensis]RDW83719.1 hypothetical protein DSM5745_04045 [Aspergillus mulundensis]
MASLETIKTVLALVFIAPYLVAYAWAKSRFRRVSYWLERRANAPTPLPRRRRSLSETETTNAQTQSLYFKLPPELRHMVYEEVLVSAAPLHVWRTYRRLCSRPCRADPSPAWEDHACSLHDECRPSMARDGSVQRRSAGDGEPVHKARFLGLLSSYTLKALAYYTPEISSLSMTITHYSLYRALFPRAGSG